MACINGIEIKNLNSFLDKDMETAYQGDIYYHGKKLGYWSQSAEGAIEDEFTFDKHILDGEAEKYKNSPKLQDNLRKYADVELLLCELCMLADVERDFNIAILTGYKSLVKIHDIKYGKYYCIAMTRPMDDAYINQENFKRFVKGSRRIDRMSNQIVVTYYNSPEDFIVEY